MTAYQLVQPGSAARLCAFVLKNAGYVVRAGAGSEDGTQAQVLAVSFTDPDKPNEGVISDCRTRGRTILAQHFVFKLAPATSAADLSAKTEAARQRIAPILANVAFADGRPSGYGDATVAVDLMLGGRRQTVPVPDALAVSFNDFDGREGPRELHLLQQKDGVARAMVWLSAAAMAEPRDLRVAGPSLVRGQFETQLDSVAPTLELAANEASREGETAVQRFAFELKKADGAPSGTLEGEAFWRGGQFVVASFFSAYDDDGSLEQFIARLPGQTAYDLLRTAASTGAK